MNGFPQIQGFSADGESASFFRDWRIITVFSRQMVRDRDCIQGIVKLLFLFHGRPGIKRRTCVVRFYIYGVICSCIDIMTVYFHIVTLLFDSSRSLTAFFLRSFALFPHCMQQELLWYISAVSMVIIIILAAGYGIFP